MTRPKTTIVVILLAGDELTAGAIDNMLYEIQSGRNGWDQDNPPRMFCLYSRWFATGQRTHQYRITSNTLTFVDRQLDLTAYPPHGERPLRGSVESQVSRFLRYVRAHLPERGPIRFIIGAHGLPGLGFSPSLRKQLIEFLSRLLAQLRILTDDKQLLHETENQLARLKDPGVVPIGFKAYSNSTTPEITLNRAGHELYQFPKQRVQSLILHTCEMSNLEAMSAMSTARHHIACETEMSSPMRFHDWFSVLADPDATESQITDACFESLRAPCRPNAVGTFSSHLTDEICSILRNLEQLGSWLSNLYVHGVPADINRQIQAARDASSVSGLSVDVVAFCLELEIACGAPTELTTPIIEAIYRSQPAPPVKRPDWVVGANFTEYRGISMYFPERKIGADPTRVLPISFRETANLWCQFVDYWLTLP